MHVSVFVAASIVVSVVSTHGAASVGRARPATSGACALITREEAATALGAPVPAGTEQAMSFQVQGRAIPAQYCLYGSEVLIARFELGNGPAAAFDQYRQSLSSESGYRDMSGLGDGAFAAKGQLAVRRGATALIIDVGQARGGGDVELAAERRLAVLALGRL